MKGRSPKVLVAVQDPGAANVVAPVAARLFNDGKTVLSVICQGFARDVLLRFSVPFKEPCDYGLRKVTSAAAERILARESPNVLLVGTSENTQSLDRLLTVKARSLGIPVISMLDYWSNYSKRFSGMSSNERFLYLPDLIFLMDEHARNDMLAEGFPPERLFVTGHPYLEGLLVKSLLLPEKKRARFRSSLGVPEGSCLVTFASETFGWSYDPSYRFPRLSRSRERTVIVLEHLLEALSELAEENKLKVFLLNKLHPKNKLGEFRWIKNLALPFPVLSLRKTDNNALIQSSSLVVGMTSMFLLEASYLGTQTLYVVPREVEERILSGEVGFSLMARNPSELRAMLRNVLVNGRLKAPPVRDRRDGVKHQGATCRAALKLYEVLGISDVSPSDY
jgi:hypothetical protein